MQSLWSGADVERMVERYAAEGVGRDLALHVKFRWTVADYISAILASGCWLGAGVTYG